MKIRAVPISALVLALLVLSACGAQTGTALSQMAAQQGENLYVAKYDGVYRYAYGNKAVTRLTELPGRHAAFYKGWIYFISDVWSEGEILYPISMDRIQKSRVMRMRPDGSKSEELYSAPYLYKIAVAEDRIVCNETEGERAGALYTLSLNGRDKVHLADNCYDFVLMDQALYYRDFEAEKPGIYKMALDGGEKTLLYGQTPAISLMPAEDWIYFICYNGQRFNPDYSFQIRRMRPDGSELERFSNELAQKINGIDSDWLYYDTYPEDNTIHSAKINLNTLEKEILIENIDITWGVTDDVILYTMRSDPAACIVNRTDNEIVIIP